MRRLLMRATVGCLLIAAAQAHAANWGDQLKQFVGNTNSRNSTAARQLPEAEVISGLKSALARGAATAVTELGRTNGFWGDATRRIPLPGWMQNAAHLLRGAGYGRQMNRMQLAMNRAAEQATAQAAPIIRQAINEMTVKDAYHILRGSNTAATDYLQAHTRHALKAKFEPIIARTTAQSQAVSEYQSLTSKVQPMLSFVPGLDLNLNDYVAQQALNGLFAVIGQQEREIRQNPAARGTALLRKVFGAVSG